MRLGRQARHARSGRQPTSLFNTLLMLALLAGGIGLLARALRPRGG